MMCVQSRFCVAVSVFRLAQLSGTFLNAGALVTEPRVTHRFVEFVGSSRCARDEWRVGNIAFLFIGGLPSAGKYYGFGS